MEAYRGYLNELAGTFALVFASAAAVCAHHAGTVPLGTLGIALAPGLVYGALLGRASRATEGFFNPAITVMLYCYRRFDGPKALALLGSQFLGAAIAGLAIRFLFNDSVLVQARVGTPHLAVDAFSQVGVGLQLQGVVAELLFTFVLTLALFGTILEPRGPRLAGFGAGLALTGCVLAGQGLTGAACNPARYLGTALWEKTVPELAENALRDHAAYWLGPTLGALLAGGLYARYLTPGAKSDS